MSDTPRKQGRASPAAPLPGDRGAAEQGLSGIDLVAIAFTLIWLVAAGGYLLFGGGLGTNGGFGALVSLVTVIMPVALIWVAATTARTARDLREEATRLRGAVDAMRQTQIAQSQAGRGGDAAPEIERKINQLAAAQRKTEDAIATFATRRDSSQIVPSADHKTALSLPSETPGEEQPALALGTPAEALRQPVSTEDFLTALNFPATPDDKAGFRALRRALEDKRAARLIRAAEDVLTLLSEDGIYMDDLQPDRARPELWRRFAQGARGGEISGLGGVRDRACLSTATARMREDPVFRDAAHHFLRQFDRMLEEFEPEASDPELSRLADTRTARAFMLLGRVAGIFD